LKPLFLVGPLSLVETNVFIKGNERKENERKENERK
jgi:hypothetical protein